MQDEKLITFAKTIVPPYKGESDPGKMTAHEICKKKSTEDTQTIIDLIYGTFEVYEKDNPKRSMLFMNAIDGYAVALENLNYAMNFAETAE